MHEPDPSGLADGLWTANKGYCNLCGWMRQASSDHTNARPRRQQCLHEQHQIRTPHVTWRWPTQYRRTICGTNICTKMSTSCDTLRGSGAHTICDPMGPTNKRPQQIEDPKRIFGVCFLFVFSLSFCLFFLVDPSVLSLSLSVLSSCYSSFSCFIFLSSVLLSPPLSLSL